MKEIKFRVRDSVNKEWLFGYNLPDLGGFSMLGDVVIMGEWGAAAWKTINDGEPDRIKLMQYTGLKDKNGVEIYEGDVVRMRFHDAPDGFVFENGEVLWHEASAAFKWSTGHPSDLNNY